MPIKLVIISHADSVGRRAKDFLSVCYSVCLFVCPEQNSKMNDPEVFKLDREWHWDNILQLVWFRVERSKVNVRVIGLTERVRTLWVPSSYCFGCSTTERNHVPLERQVIQMSLSELYLASCWGLTFTACGKTRLMGPPGDEKRLMVSLAVSTQ